MIRSRWRNPLRQGTSPTGTEPAAPCPYCGALRQPGKACPNCGRRFGLATSTRLPRWATLRNALVLLLLIGIGVLILVGQTTESETSFVSPQIGEAQFRSLQIGTSENSVTRQLGKGEDALNFYSEGLATEPMDADCIYYDGTNEQGQGRIFQLCFRHGNLTSKSSYAPL